MSFFDKLKGGMGIEESEKADAFDPDDKDWPEAHGAHDTESGPEV